MQLNICLGISIQHLPLSNDNSKSTTNWQLELQTKEKQHPIKSVIILKMFIGIHIVTVVTKIVFVYK